MIVERSHPAVFARSLANADRFRKLVAGAVRKTGGTFVERNSILLRRGPYVIVAVLDESVDRRPLRISGSFVDLLDPQLAVRRDLQIQPGQQAWLLDLNRTAGPRPLLLSAAGRVESWNTENGKLSYTISSPEGVQASTRILLDKSPTSIQVDGKPCEAVQWDERSKTLLLRHPGKPEPVKVSMTVET